MKKLLIFAAVLLLSFKLATPGNPPTGKPKKQQPEYVKMYIDKYLETAQCEADRYNIPVSITLAQGIIESNCGRSELSSKHNNHFGIKWRKGRKEKYAIYKDDSPKDKFVVYKSPWYSYRDHSKLLTSPHYRHLTKLKRTEYKKWAYGLKKCGYATAPHYAKTLIKIIETYKLDRFDR